MSKKLTTTIIAGLAIPLTLSLIYWTVDQLMEVQRLKQELDSTNEKVEGYRQTIEELVKLHLQ